VLGVLVGIDFGRIGYGFRWMASISASGPSRQVKVASRSAETSQDRSR
jgi:hypothetical protein